MRARQCRRCPATFPLRADHCPQCGNCDYTTVTVAAAGEQPGGAEVVQRTPKRHGRSRIKAVA